MEQRFNPLDPLGIFRRVKKDVDRIASSTFSLPLPGPPGIGNPIPAEFNGKLVDMRDEARRRLIDAGYSETATDRALNWHDEWLMGMVRMLAPNDMNIQRTLVQKAYSEIAPRAEKWIRGIQEAFGVPAAV